jgi:hypothetical protein
MGELAQSLQILLGHELGCNRKNADLVIADQHGLPAAQSGDGFAQGSAVAMSRREWFRLDHPLLLAAHHMAW